MLSLYKLDNVYFLFGINPENKQRELYKCTDNQPDSWTSWKKFSLRFEDGIWATAEGNCHYQIEFSDDATQFALLIFIQDDSLLLKSVGALVFTQVAPKNSISAMKHFNAWQTSQKPKAKAAEQPLSSERKSPLINFPDTYGEFFKAANPLAGARALLNDYTKDDNAFFRFISGHWNRHYVGKVCHIVTLIDAGKINNEQELKIHLLLLRKDIENPAGSLARRIKFILGKFDEETPRLVLNAPK